jgi:hypothetical protein
MHVQYIPYEMESFECATILPYTCIFCLFVLCMRTDAKRVSETEVSNF